MGIIPTIESTIDDFRRSTSARIELDGGKCTIGGNGILLAAAHFLETLQAENAALKEQVAQLDEANEHHRTLARVSRDNELRAMETIAQLNSGFEDYIKEAVDFQAWQQRSIDDRNETIAQQAEALRVKDEALSYCVPAYFALCIQNIDEDCKEYEWVNSTGLRLSEAMSDKDESILGSLQRSKQALAIQPSTDILRERDARLVERIAASTMDYYPEVDILLGIADQIKKGTFK